MLASAVVACASTAGSDASVSGSFDAGGTADVLLADVQGRDAIERCDGVLPGTDTDGDGLDDVVEDANRNCVFDEGETDPLTADTDGDGLDDGVEDVDRNGVWDASRGELDPRRADTNGDGVGDGDEPLASVCTSALLDEVALHRVASGDSVFFIDPALDATSVFEGRGLVVVDPDVPRAALLATRLGTPMRVEELVAALEVGARVIGADLWWESETSGAVRRLSVAIEASYDVPMSTVIGALAEAASVDLDPASVESTASSRRYALRIEAEARPGDRIDGRVAVALSGESDPLPWHRAMGVGAIAPDARSTLRARCDTARAETIDVVDVVVAWSPSPVIEFGLSDVITAVGGLLADRSSDERLTRVWLIPGDGHAWETAGRPTDAAAYGRFDQVFDAAFSVVPTTDDQRVWLNALAFIETLDERVETVGSVELIAVLGREDTEFREGERDGRDGAPDGAPLAPGPARDARTGWYSQRFDALEVDVTGVALRSGQNGACGIDQRSGAEAPLAAAASARDVALASGGVFLDICAPGLELALERRLVRAAGGAGRFSLAESPVSGDVLVHEGDDGAPVSGYEVIDDDGGVRVAVPSRSTTDSFVTGYRFWDVSPTD